MSDIKLPDLSRLSLTKNCKTVPDYFQFSTQENKLRQTKVLSNSISTESRLR